MHRKHSNKADKRREHTTRGPGPRSGRSWSLESLHTHTKQTRQKVGKPPISSAVFLPRFQKYISILPISVSENPEKTPKHTKEMFTFDPFLPLLMHFWLCWVPEMLRDAGVNIGGMIYRESLQKGTPPPYLGSKKRLYPHNFSPQKYRKKSPWSNRKKISEKICGKMFRGKRKPPILWKGGKGC